MSNRYAAWYLRVNVPDIDSFGGVVKSAGWWHDDEAGDGLPVDFPRDEFTEEQLVLLEEYYYGKRDEVVRGWFGLLRVHPRSAELSLGHVVLNAGILVKLLGVGDARSYSWGELAEKLGVGEAALYRHKKAILDELRRMKK